MQKIEEEKQKAIEEMERQQYDSFSQIAVRKKIAGVMRVRRKGRRMHAG